MGSPLLLCADSRIMRCIVSYGLVSLCPVLYLDRVRDLGIDEKVFILAGVGPLASARAARWMRDNVPGIHIPDAVILRMESAEKPGDEGKKLCIELIQQIREIGGVAGVHVMAYRREHLVHDIIEESGLLKERLAAIEAERARA